MRQGPEQEEGPELGALTGSMEATPGFRVPRLRRGPPRLRALARPPPGTLARSAASAVRIRVVEKEEGPELGALTGSMEATPGFEPGVKALQASALPLGHVALY